LKNKDANDVIILNGFKSETIMDMRWSLIRKKENQHFLIAKEKIF
jgi:hypothetical protein